jgi:hypothetical protein
MSEAIKLLHGTWILHSRETIYEGLSPSATLVARVQGPDISADDWLNMFTIVFEAAS